MSQKATLPPQEAKEGEQVKVEDMVEKAWSSGEKYAIEEVKQELKYSFTPIDGIKDFNDTDGEKIYCIMGYHGVGKTSCVHQLAAEIGAELFAFNLGGTVQEDLHGLPIIEEVDGVKVAGHAAAKMCMPLLRAPKSKSGIGIWLLDEIFSGVSMDHQMFVRMIAGGKCDEMKMYPGWFVVGTTNPPSVEYMGVQKIDSSTADRFVFFCTKSSSEDKLKYWRDKMHPLTFKFLLLNHVKKLSYVDALSARTWWNISKELAKRQAMGAPASSLTRILTTHAGTDVAAAFVAYLGRGDDPAFYPLGCSEILNSEEPEFGRIIARVKKWVADGNTPLIGATKWDITSWIYEDVVEKKVAVSDAHVKRLSTFMVEVGANGYADIVDDIFQACSQTKLMERLLDATRNTALKTELVKVYRKHKEALA